MTAPSRQHAEPPDVSWASWLGVLALAVAVALLLAPRPAASQPSGDVDAGRDVYASTCAMCHGEDATGMMRMHPALRGAVERLTAEGVEVTIRNGRQTTPPMPAFDGTLSDDQITNVIAYLDTLPAGPRNFGPDMMDRDGMMDDGGMMDRMIGPGWAWMLGAVVLIVLLVAVVVLVVSQRGGHAQGGDGGEDEDARAILDRRYAAGELSREHYRQAREDLDR